TSVYVLGERLAKEKLGEWIEGSKRYYEVRPHAYFMVTKGEAFQVLQAGPEISPTLSKEVLEMNKQTIRQNGVSLDVTLAQFGAWLMSPDREAVLPAIKLIYPQELKGADANGPNKAVAIEGLGVFRGTKLVGWLNREESIGSQLIMENRSSGAVFLQVDVDGRKFTYTLQRSKHKVKSSLVGDKPTFQVTIETQGSVADPEEETISTEELSRMEDAAAEKIREIAFQAIDKAKEYDSDFLGFTEKLHRTNPSAWQKIEPHWRESFQEADVDVEVKAKILDTGKSGPKLKLKQ
ncbi:MAG: Ger(x)C family spore germination protein, partial [Bacillota bacterium]|nr:Ger(x)C family spore germination protein [Bacillota bacterium]